MKVQKLSTLRCPICKHQILKRMPLEKTISEFVCMNCSSIIKTKRHECCVFCTYGSVKCPRAQAWRLLENILDGNL
ncbi:GDCCVxC domain-containing (seleno)protein [Catalinimonas alkaloidigena]|uniref:GDCCVxC domain-containing (seleno)protein n=1 Tax=Catalinimonas alkaloidigena TaxID=1075417 RepID=UPI003B8A5E9E